MQLKSTAGRTFLLSGAHFLCFFGRYSHPSPRTALPLPATTQDILETFKSLGTTNDAVLINTMFDIGRTLHDSVDLLSSDGDRKHIAGLLCGFIDKIDYGKDLEQQLNVYVECRAIFCNLDQVKDKLVLCVSELAVKAYRYMRGKHSKKTAAFAKACLAFCHITTPSITYVPRKLQLLLHCANVAELMRYAMRHQLLD